MRFQNLSSGSEVTYFDALQLHFKLGSDPSLIFHCSHVVNVAYQIIQQLPENIALNAELVLIGAFLHDIGRNETQSIRHGVVGSEIIIREFPHSKFLDDVSRIISCHIGGGIPKSETKDLGLPEEDFIPVSLEEKIVCYADKMVDYKFDKSKGNYEIKKWFTFNSVENESEKLSSKLGSNHPAVARLHALENDLLQINHGKQFNFTTFKKK